MGWARINGTTYPKHGDVISSLRLRATFALLRCRTLARATRSLVKMAVSAFRRVSELQAFSKAAQHSETRTLIDAGECQSWQLGWRSTADVIGGYGVGEAKRRRILWQESEVSDHDPLVVVRIGGWRLVFCSVCWRTISRHTRKTQRSNSLSVAVTTGVPRMSCLCALARYRVPISHLKSVSSPIAA
ncbi:hypothetical protein LZ32DRAFT_362891 [Colletotrichum eremochloae]|nr:hypothetical protein LZ32DRAFT_362891 [Colletotrichum eremochloae]